eukprot:5406308-Pyramimonas_sp.AAC.1
MLPQADDDFPEREEATRAHVAEQDERLLRQHHRHATCALQASDIPAEFDPRSGAFQGNSVATDEFRAPRWQAVPAWGGERRIFIYLLHRLIIRP